MKREQLPMASGLIKALTNRRIGKGLRQAYVGSLVGVSGQTIWKWESGQTEPSLSDTIRWAQALGYEMSATLRTDIHRTRPLLHSLGNPGVA